MLKKHDWVITTLVIILSIVGLFTILSTNIDNEGNIAFSGVVTNQVIYMVIGLVAYFLISLFNYNYLKYKHLLIPIYIVTIGLLIVALLFGPVINNVQRWIVIGNYQLQPAEFAKLTVILISAIIMSSRSKLNDIFLAGLSFVAIIPILVLIYLQPHGSMTLMLLLIWLLTVFTYIRDQKRNVMMVAISALIVIGIVITFIFDRSLGAIVLTSGGILSIFAFYSKQNWRLFAVGAVGIGLIGGFLLVGSWNNLLKDYQRDRIETFFQVEEQDDDQAFNVEQSKVAIGSGGLFGKGFGFGTQSRLNYLPEHQTDFIFATYAEQFGMLGSLFLLGIFTFLIVRIIMYSMQFAKHDQFGSMIAFGIAIMFLLEVFINVGTNTGIIPATGIPLPLISAGGSNVLLTFFSLGLIQSIISHCEMSPDKDSFIDKEDLLI